MKKQTKKIILIGISMFFILFFMVGASIFNKYFHENIQNHPKMYCYQTFYGPSNPVLIIEDLKYKKDYIKFYNKVSQGKNPVFNFPLKTISTCHPVYVMGYSKDSLLAEIVSYKRKLSNDYTRGWVYAKTLHKNPPPENN